MHWISELPSFVHLYGSYTDWFDVVVNQFSNVDGADWVFLNIFLRIGERDHCAFSFLNNTVILIHRLFVYPKSWFWPCGLDVENLEGDDRRTS